MQGVVWSDFGTKRPMPQVSHAAALAVRAASWLRDEEALSDRTVAAVSLGACRAVHAAELGLT